MHVSHLQWCYLNNTYVLDSISHTEQLSLLTLVTAIATPFWFHFKLAEAPPLM